MTISQGPMPAKSQEVNQRDDLIYRHRYTLSELGDLFLKLSV